MEAFQKANLAETLAGHIVLSVGCNTRSDTELLAAGELTPGMKLALDELHKRKIDMADEILVINVGGYIGRSTASEIHYARGLFKPVRYMEPRRPIMEHPQKAQSLKLSHLTPAHTPLPEAERGNPNNEIDSGTKMEVARAFDVIVKFLIKNPNGYPVRVFYGNKEKTPDGMRDAQFSIAVIEGAEVATRLTLFLKSNQLMQPEGPLPFYVPPSMAAKASPAVQTPVEAAAEETDGAIAFEESVAGMRLCNICAAYPSQFLGDEGSKYFCDGSTGLGRTHPVIETRYHPTNERAYMEWLKLNPSDAFDNKP